MVSIESNRGRHRLAKISLSFKAGLVGLAYAAVSVPSYGQQAPTPLPTRDELDPESALQKPEARRVEIDGDIERAPCALADPAYANIKVTLTSASFNNLGPVQASDLRPAYAAYLGRELPIATICDVRDAAATILRRQGYLAAVQVPVQRIENGVVTFEILYAKLTTIRVLGKAGRNEALLEKTLSQLITGQPFNRLDAERYLLLARDIPGYDIRLSLKPIQTGAGDMLGEISVRHTPVQADLNIQNYAPRDSGRWGGQLRVQLNGLTGNGDRTTLGFYSTADFREQQVAQIAHEMQIGSSGLRFGGRFTYAWSHPSLGATFQNVRARTKFANAEMSYPFIRSQAASLRAAIGLDVVNQRVRFGGLPLSEDRLRVGYLRFDGEAVDLKGIGPGRTIGWRANGSLEFRHGFSIFGASPNCLATPARCLTAGNSPSLGDGDPTATVVRFSGNVDLRVLRNVVVSVQPRAQTSSGALLAFEQFSLGNYTVGRGYEPGTLVGDRGIGVTTEVRLDSFRLSPGSKLAMAPYLFVDNGWVWNKGAAAGVNPERLNSFGGGVRLNIADRARLDMSVAVPRRRAGLQTERGDTRFLVSFTTNLFPWSNR